MLWGRHISRERGLDGFGRKKDQETLKMNTVTSHFLVASIAIFLLSSLPVSNTLAQNDVPICTQAAGRTHTEEFQFTHAFEHDALSKGIPAGSVIGSIRLRRLSVFDLQDPAEDRWLYRLANRLHPTTRESVIFSQLLITKGAEFNLARLDESERILRELQFIYDATVRPWRVCGKVVDIEVITRDTWTFSPIIAFSRSGGENSYALGVSESNFLGSGKQVTLEAVGNEERSGVLFIYDDPAVLDSRWKMRLGLNENDDGYDRALSLVRPFFSVYEKYSAGLYLRQFELEEKNWFRGNKFEEFDHEGEMIRVFGGTALDTREQHRVGRLLFGYHLEANSFDYSNSSIPPSQLPPSRDYSYPFIGYQSIEDEYSKVKNINYLGRTEDLYVGESYKWTLGWSDESLGASQDQLALNAQYSNTLLASPDHLWLASTTLSGFYSFEDEEFENLWWSTNTRYHMKQSEKWALFGQLRVDYTDSLTADKQLVLGGENGLRGYDRNYQVGDRSFVLNIEQRYYSDWHPFRLMRVGGAVFFDAGRAWFKHRNNGSNGDTLANAGLGLRFNSSRTQKGSVIHVDLAFPLIKDQFVDDVQFLISAKRAF